MNVQSSSFPSTFLQQSAAPANEASTLNLNAGILASSQQDSQKNSDFFNSAGNSGLSDVISQNSEGNGSETYDLGKLAGGSMGIVAGGCYCDGPTEVDEDGKIVISCHTTYQDLDPMRETDSDLFMDFVNSQEQVDEESFEPGEMDNSDIVPEPYTGPISNYGDMMRMFFGV